MKKPKLETVSGAKWEMVSKKTPESEEQILKILLANRGLTTKKAQEDFFNPPHPNDLTLEDVELKSESIKKAIKRIRVALQNKEKVIVFGDYDADGITASGVLWETLYSLGLSVKPYLPDRFTEGYGIKSDAIKKLKDSEDISLIITVDNGIVAHEAIAEAQSLGIDVIITDHHQPAEIYPEAYAVIHSTAIGGAAVAWFFAREIRRVLKISDDKLPFGDALELAAIGTIADQIPLIGPNRSIVKHGLTAINKSKRVGLQHIFTESQLTSGAITCYDIGFIVAPRINAMGRLEHGMDSLRLLCTPDPKRARQLSLVLGKTNKERQMVVEKVLTEAKIIAGKTDWSGGVIVVAHESFHEGVIGLAAGKLVENYHLPAIVLSKGDTLSKASARSITGFNIIDAIRATGDLIVGGGGHPMAAGFTIETAKIDTFIAKLNEIAKQLLTADILTKRKKIDLAIPFSAITDSLVSKLNEFEPVGLGNPTPTFVTDNVGVLDIRSVGRENKHLKLKLIHGETLVDAIGFNLGSVFPKITPETKLSVVYSVEENVWNGNVNLQLKIRDIGFQAK